MHFMKTYYVLFFHYNCVKLTEYLQNPILQDDDYSDYDRLNVELASEDFEKYLTNIVGIVQSNQYDSNSLSDTNNIKYATNTIDTIMTIICLREQNKNANTKQELAKMEQKEIELLFQTCFMLCSINTKLKIKGNDRYNTRKLLNNTDLTSSQIKALDSGCDPKAFGSDISNIKHYDRFFGNLCYNILNYQKKVTEL